MIQAVLRSLKDNSYPHIDSKHTNYYMILMLQRTFTYTSFCSSVVFFIFQIFYTEHGLLLQNQMKNMIFKGLATGWLEYF